MSRSYKKTNIGGNAIANSEKKDKRTCHGMFRAMERNAIQAGKYDECPTSMREAMNVWSMAKDGKRFFTNPVYLRK
jgi:hypothetical protein